MTNVAINIMNYPEATCGASKAVIPIHEELTMKELGKVMGISESMVSKLHLKSRPDRRDFVMLDAGCWIDQKKIMYHKTRHKT